MGLLGGQDGKEENGPINTQHHTKLFVYLKLYYFHWEGDAVGWQKCRIRIWYLGTLRTALVSLPVKLRRLKRSFFF